MPNTLAHIGVQTLVTRGVLRRADPLWILAGCLIPDVPWILQRLVRAGAPALDAYDVRLYAIAQSSLVVSLVACALLAALAAAPRRAFGVLALGALLHLLLDALQTKLANGVHLLAPFSWRLLNLGLFWPESPVTWVLTGLGLVVGLELLRRGPALPELRLEASRLALAALLAGLYLALPVALMAGPEAADNHSVRTLRERSLRPGRAVAFDRNDYLHTPAGDFLVSLGGERLRVVGARHAHPGTVSARARFADEDSIEILELHEHRGWSRDLGSVAGIALIGAYAAAAGLRRRKRGP
jgi:hypothetical protein